MKDSLINDGLKKVFRTKKNNTLQGHLTVIPYMHYKEHSRTIVPKMKRLVIIIQSLETLELSLAAKSLRIPAFILASSVCVIRSANRFHVESEPGRNNSADREG